MLFRRNSQRLIRVALYYRQHRYSESIIALRTAIMVHYTVLSLLGGWTGHHINHDRNPDVYIGFHSSPDFMIKEYHAFLVLEINYRFIHLQF